MKRIFFSGIKGGVGTTSIVANLATLLAKANRPVIAVDLDKKNELGIHFGHSWTDTLGWSNVINENQWQNFFFKNEDDVCYLPYGDKAFGENLTCLQKLSLLDVEPDTWLLLDCPAGTSAETLNLKEKDLFINVLNCDANCYSLINRQPPHEINHYYLINRFDAQNNLETDIYQIWRANLNGLAPFFIHTDSAVKEALAYKNVMINYATYSVAKEDFQALGSWLVTKLKDDA